jgi:hypothetical protein
MRNENTAHLVSFKVGYEIIQRKRKEYQNISGEMCVSVFQYQTSFYFSA